MEIDTLIFSGASTRGVVFFGCLDYLIENNLLDKNFKNIKKIFKYLKIQKKYSPFFYYLFKISHFIYFFLHFSILKV